MYVECKNLLLKLSATSTTVRTKEDTIDKTNFIYYSFIENGNKNNFTNSHENKRNTFYYHCQMKITKRT